MVAEGCQVPGAGADSFFRDDPGQAVEIADETVAQRGGTVREAPFGAARRGRVIGGPVENAEVIEHDARCVSDSTEPAPVQALAGGLFEGSQVRLGDCRKGISTTPVLDPR